MGSRSVLLLEGARAPRAAQADAAAVPRRAHARVRGDRARGRRARGRDAGPSGEPFALHPRMQAITLEVILRAVFGVTDSAAARGCAERLGAAARRRRRRPGCSSACCSRGGFGGPDPLARLQALRAGDRRAARRRDRRRARAEPRRGHPVAADRGALRGRRADGRRRDPRPADDAAARRATRRPRPALAWTFDLLLRHPHALERLRRVDAGDDAYLRAVVAESLRLRPVVPLAGRRLSAELRVDGHVLPPGTDVTPAIWLAHTRADRYPEPYAFRPERFLDDAPATLRVDPVRRRRAALPRRGVRRDGDARGARRDRCAGARCGPPRPRPSGSRAAT